MKESPGKRSLSACGPSNRCRRSLLPQISAPVKAMTRAQGTEKGFSATADCHPVVKHITKPASPRVPKMMHAARMWRRISATGSLRRMAKVLPALKNRRDCVMVRM